MNISTCAFICNLRISESFRGLRNKYGKSEHHHCDRIRAMEGKDFENVLRLQRLESGTRNVLMEELSRSSRIDDSIVQRNGWFWLKTSIIPFHRWVLLSFSCKVFVTYFFKCGLDDLVWMCCWWQTISLNCWYTCNDGVPMVMLERKAWCARLRCGDLPSICTSCASCMFVDIVYLFDECQSMEPSN